MNLVNGKRVDLPNSASADDIVRASGRRFNPNTRCAIPVFALKIKA